MTNKQFRDNEKWFEGMTSYLKDGGHLIVPMFNEVYIYKEKKIRPQTFAGMVAIKKIVSEKWFDENVGTIL